LLLLFAASSVGANVQDFNWVSEAGEITITGYTGAGGAVTIPGTIEEQSVVAIGNNAFYVKSSVTSVTMSDGLKSIGQLAFANCSALASVSIPATVTNIGWSAFSDCSAMETVFIPESVTTIGEYAFYRCSSMSSIAVAAGNTAYSSHEGVLYNKDQTLLL
jgi:hypothetical protein